MSELQAKLRQRRSEVDKAVEEEGTVYDGDAWKAEASVTKKDSESTTFRSGWGSSSLQMDRFRKAPEEQWMVPRLSWTGGVGTANPTVMTPRGTNPAILPRNSMPGRLGQEVAGVKPDDLKATPGSLPSKGSPSKQELKAQQKQRLDKLLEFASKENDRLNRLIEESQGDAQQESVQVTKLLESKKNTERLFQDVVKQRDALETALKSAEAERDVAMAQSKVLTVEREELEGQVAKAALENERLQCVVADTLAEKERLEGIAREKAEVERQLAEVETEVEDNDEEDPCDTSQAPQLCEIPEEVCGAPEAQDGGDDEEDAEAVAFTSRPASSTSSGRRRTSSCGAGRADGASRDYQVSEASRDVWKAFGCETKAGRALRGLYSSGSHAQNAASKISYPRLESPASRWEPKKLPRKPCPQQAVTRVPRPKACAGADRDDPRNWPAGLPCPKRKPAAEILAEMEAARPEVPDSMVPGRDQNSEKQMLQDHFRYCGGNMMPKGAMGNVPVGELPKVAERAAARDQVDLNGMTAEHREIFQELALAIQRKQARIDEIDAEDRENLKPSRKKTERNKEALELKNAIGVCLKDIDRLLALTEADQ